MKTLVVTDSSPVLQLWESDVCSFMCAGFLISL